MFDEIRQAVAAGPGGCGAADSRGQLTYAARAAQSDRSGAMWLERTACRCRWAGNGVRRDLGRPTADELNADRAGGIAYGLAIETCGDARVEVRPGARYGAGRPVLGMYVNAWTEDYGPRGRAAVQRLLDERATAGLVPARWDGGVHLTAAVEGSYLHVALALVSRRIPQKVGDGRCLIHTTRWDNDQDVHRDVLVFTERP